MTLNFIENNKSRQEHPRLYTYEIEHALFGMKNKKSPGQDKVVIDSIKMGGKRLLKAPDLLFNECLTRSITLTQWNNATLTLNYRPIHLLSQIHKLFTKVIINRRTAKLDHYQQPGQVGFRLGYDTNDHLQAQGV